MENKLKQEKANIIKVVLFGPESTGKTTLSQQLARHYNTVWVAEYAREYLQDKWNNTRKTCENSDLIPIAEGQMRLENELAKKQTKSCYVIPIYWKPKCIHKSITVAL
jgi:nicotinamide riboside kinase